MSRNRTASALAITLLLTGCASSGTSSPAESDSSTVSSGSSNTPTPSSPVDSAATTTTVTIAPLGSLRAAAGTVTVVHDGGAAITVADAETVVTGDRVTVAPGGLAELTTPAGVMRVGDASKAVAFDLETPAGTTTISLEHGNVWIVATTGSLAITLPDAGITVAPGDLSAGIRASGLRASDDSGRAAVLCDDGGCAVAALAGSVSVGTDGAASAVLSLGTALDLVGGSAPVAVAPSATAVTPFLLQNVQLDRAGGIGPEPTTGATSASLDGSYVVTYRTVENDRDPLTDETVDRAVTIATACVRFTCTLDYGTELKDPVGNIIVLHTPLTFDGTAYHGQLTSTDPCLDRSFSEIPDAQIYTGQIDVEPTTAEPRDDGAVVVLFQSTATDDSVIAPAGQAAGCRINLNNDGFSAHSVSTGPGVRLPNT